MATKTEKKPTKPKPEAKAEPAPEEVKKPEVKFQTLFTVVKDETGYNVKAGEATVKTFKKEATATELAAWLNCGYTAFREKLDANKK